MHLTTHSIPFPSWRCVHFRKTKNHSLVHTGFKKNKEQHTAVLRIVNSIATKAYIITTEDFKSL